METTNAQSVLVDVSPGMLKEWLGQDDTVLVDVREDFEHAVERIANSKHHPLSKLDPKAIEEEHPGKRVVFHCRSGKRSKQAALRFHDGKQQVFHLAGGIEAWKSAGLKTVRSEAGPRIDIMRQVQITAGSLVLTGVILGVFASKWFLLLSGFVGAGLIFAGLSGWCGMAKLLARMPWNKSMCRRECNP